MAFSQPHNPVLPSRSCGSYGMDGVQAASWQVSTAARYRNHDGDRLPRKGSGPELVTVRTTSTGTTTPRRRGVSTSHWWPRVAPRRTRRSPEAPYRRQHRMSARLRKRTPRLGTSVSARSADAGIGSARERGRDASNADRAVVQGPSPTPDRTDAPDRTSGVTSGGRFGGIHRIGRMVHTDQS